MITLDIKTFPLIIQMWLLLCGIYFTPVSMTELLLFPEWIPYIEDMCSFHTAKQAPIGGTATDVTFSGQSLIPVAVEFLLCILCCSGFSSSSEGRKVL